MKYLKSYKLFESKGKYYIGGHHWEYQLGYLWSPKVIIGGSHGVEYHSRNDASVNIVSVEDDGGSTNLSCSTVQSLFQEHLGTSNLDDLCLFYLNELGYAYGPKDEFSFLNKGLIEKRCYVNIEVPGKPNIIQQVPDFKKHYLDIVGDIIGHKFTEKDRKDVTNGKDNKYYSGSWHVNVGLYDIDGIKLISTELGGDKCYILKRDDIEKLLDMTKTYNFYRFVDKDLQVLRIKGKRINSSDVADIFVDVTDNRIKLEDFTQIEENQVMVKFTVPNTQFSKEVVNDISEDISRFEEAYGCKFDRIDLSRNTMMYINDSNKTWLLKDRPVHSFTDVNELLRIGPSAHDLHLREHAMYIIFNF